MGHSEDLCHRRTLRPRVTNESSLSTIWEILIILSYDSIHHASTVSSVVLIYSVLLCKRDSTRTRPTGSTLLDRSLGHYYTVAAVLLTTQLFNGRTSSVHLTSCLPSKLSSAPTGGGLLLHGINVPAALMLPQKMELWPVKNVTSKNACKY